MQQNKNFTLTLAVIVILTCVMTVLVWRSTSQKNLTPEQQQVADVAAISDVYLQVAQYLATFPDESSRSSEIVVSSNHLCENCFLATVTYDDGAVLLLDINGEEITRLSP